MTPKEKLLMARDHIRAKEYEQARVILETVDHPKAYEWLERINQILPSSEPVQQPGRSRRGLLLTGVMSLIVMIAIAGIVLVAPQISNFGGLVTQTVSKDFPLARYFPHDTLTFTNIRVDDNHIQSWDTLAVHIQDSLPDFVAAMVLDDEPYTLTYVLDTITELSLNGDFQTTVRSWLGDELAIGGFNFQINADTFQAQPQDVGFVMIADITNREGAIAFVEQVLSNNPYIQLEKLDRNGFTIYLSPDETFAIMVNDEVLLLATQYAMGLIENGIPDSLRTAPQFTETMALLPESQYNINFYLDVRQYIETLMPLFEAMQADLAEIAEEMPDNELMPMGFIRASIEDFLPEGMTLEDAFEAMGQIGVGFTIVDDYTLLMDGTFNIGNPQLWHDLQIMPSTLNSTDPAFLSYVPQDAMFVTHGIDIKTQVEQYLRAETMQREMIETNAELFDMMPLDTIQLEPMRTGIAQIDAAIEPTTGLTVERDILSWMSGNYVVFANYEPDMKSMLFGYYYEDEQLEQNAEFGVILEVTDVTKAQALVQSMDTLLPVLLENPDIVVQSEEIAGRTVAVIPIPPDDLLRTPLDIVIGTNDDVFVFGTRGAVTEILTGQGGFDTSTGYVDVQSRLLSNAYTMTYLGTNGFDLIADSITGLLTPAISRIFTNITMELNSESEDMELRQQQMREQARATLPMTVQSTRFVTDLLESMTVSTYTTAEYDSVSRWTLTFAD